MFAYLQKSTSPNNIPVCLQAALGHLEQFPHTGPEKLLFIFSGLLSANSQGSELASQIIVANRPVQPNTVLFTAYLT
jgi:hypothetical protein